MDRIQKPLNKIGAFHLISTGQQSAEQLALIAEKIIDHVDALHLREKNRGLIKKNDLKRSAYFNLKVYHWKK
ncbi:hypothetical protein K6959_06435 [Bacillus aquiflavi]|uniref:hypothetical protein n=1 Tax=Bacillus aquiflavi TaxID=2672567 RepID=UPI001CA8B529|nr:hypothetical protein [Bacillus aquiflavi]UAC49472.1 hypothetical protein K6959_06435 [Bacillus aquiflavi]